MAPLGEVSLVTEQDFRRVDTVTNDVERDLSAHLASATDENSPPTSNEPDHVPSVGDGVLPEPKPDGSDRGEGTELLSQMVFVLKTTPLLFLSGQRRLLL